MRGLFFPPPSRPLSFLAQLRRPHRLAMGGLNTDVHNIDSEGKNKVQRKRNEVKRLGVFIFSTISKRQKRALANIL